MANKPAYHFTSDKLRDGSPIPEKGKWLHYKLPIRICNSGLHASFHPFDALQFAPGCLLHLVEVKNIRGEHEDKFVCASRKIVKTIDATKVLRKFARMQALSVINNWNAPSVVVEYLKTGDESLQSAARSAARYAAESAAWSAAESAAEYAAWYAARSAAEYAAWYAARSAAEYAAESAAEYAAWYAARSAAEYAAESAAESAARSAARSAAKDMFKQLIDEAFSKEI